MGEELCNVRYRRRQRCPELKLTCADINSGKKREPAAKAIVDKFVKPGSERENGCLSSATKSELLEAETIEEHYFHFAKQEALNDIYMNTTLRSILQPKEDKDDHSSA
jgi:hypothetical protein